jgi:primosomal protein N' (replication factor Y) (superfamily II helicase)
MHYIEVMVAGSAYHGSEALTYSCSTELARGVIVTVPLRNAAVLGVVMAEVPKPSFTVKPILSTAALPLLPEETLQLMDWLQSYYPAPAGIIAQQFLPKSLPKKPVENPPLNATTVEHLPPLTRDQERVLQAVGKEGMHLLHGDTGTGKTRVYIELAKRAVQQNKSALILTPEIGLTSQLADDFEKAFGKRIFVIHSQLTEVTRQRQWVALLKQEEPVIVIGPRSALFAPLHHLGLIVIDEAHETAYKQDQSPYYHASRVASKLAALHHCPIILGSATPLVQDYYLATVRHKPILRMTHTAVHDDTATSNVSVIDLRDRSLFTKKSYLSDKLIKAIGDAIAKGEQTLLFLNRRGTARVVFCEDCGWEALCPHCDIPLVYHGDAHIMRCHTCEYRSPVPTTCPSCSHTSVVFKSVGTKAIVDEVQRLFPEARIQRFDTDNKKTERVEQHYAALKSGDIDIIVGTQTLAKGLDLPMLSVVGIIIADTGLYFPDFSAQERTYQLISQVLGRIGRGHRSGLAIIQTYNPESSLLRAILHKDWSAFYDSELAERRSFTFPPFCYLLKLTCRRATQINAEQTAQKFADELRQSGLRIAVEGPAPAFHEKVQNKFQWQLTVKAKDRIQLVQVIKKLPSGWSYDIDPMNIL